MQKDNATAIDKLETLLNRLLDSKQQTVEVSTRFLNEIMSEIKSLKGNKDNKKINEIIVSGGTFDS